MTATAWCASDRPRGSEFVVPTEHRWRFRKRDTAPTLELASTASRRAGRASVEDRTQCPRLPTIRREPDTRRRACAELALARVVLSSRHAQSRGARRRPVRLRSSSSHPRGRRRHDRARGARRRDEPHDVLLDTAGHGCLGLQIGDGVTNDVAHGAGEVLLVGGIVAVIGGLAGLSNEHAVEADAQKRR